MKRRYEIKYHSFLTEGRKYDKRVQICSIVMNAVKTMEELKIKLENDKSFILKLDLFTNAVTISMNSFRFCG